MNQMKKHLQLLFLGIILFNGLWPNANAQTTVSNNFDDGVMAPFLECTTKDPHYTIVEDGRVKTYWSSEDGWDGTRADKGAEMCIATDDFNTTKEGWYGFTMTLGADYPVNKNAGVAQIFGFSDYYYTWEAMLIMENNELKMEYRGKGSEQPGAADITEETLLSAPPRETDMNIIIHFILSANETGVLEVWIDGEQVMDHESINLGFGTWVDDIQTCDECRTELKAGMYNYDYDNWDYDETRTVYYDNVTMYNSSDGYDIVDPSQGEDLIDYIEFVDASVTDDNSAQVRVEITEEVAEYDSYEGFTVNVDDAEVVIDSVSYDSVDNELVINLANALTKDNVVTLSYLDGNIVTALGAAFVNFSDTLVSNLLAGAAPVISVLETSTDGLNIIATFNKNMNLPSSLESLSVTADYNGTNIMSFSEVAFYDADSTMLSFTLSEQVFYDYDLYLSYTGSVISSIDEGVISSFADSVIVNNAAGLPFEVEASSIDTSGLFANFKLNREIAVIQDQSDNFSFTINDETVECYYTVVADSTIMVYPVGKIYVDDEVEVSYEPGSLVSILATNTAELDAFDVSVVNFSTIKIDTVPGKIEAEDYLDQSGITTEDCDEGGEDIGYINTDDWVEYLVNVKEEATYQATFRVATTKDDGVITIYADDEEKGSVDIPNTEDWQTYESVSVDLYLNAGEQILKLLFTNSFNINWMEFEEITDLVASVDEDLWDGIEVYPNPVVNELVVESMCFEYDKVRILDALGRVVFSQQGYASKQTFNLDVSKGIYILELSNVDQKITKMFVKF